MLVALKIYKEWASLKSVHKQPVNQSINIYRDSDGH